MTANRKGQTKSLVLLKRSRSLVKNFQSRKCLPSGKTMEFERNWESATVKDPGPVGRGPCGDGVCWGRRGPPRSLCVRASESEGLVRQLPSARELRAAKSFLGAGCGICLLHPSCEWGLERSHALLCEPSVHPFMFIRVPLFSVPMGYPSMYFRDFCCSVEAQ